jgi:hypothetical protein
MSRSILHAHGSSTRLKSGCLMQAAPLLRSLNALGSGFRCAETSYQAPVMLAGSRFPPRKRTGLLARRRQALALPKPCAGPYGSPKNTAEMRIPDTTGAAPEVALRLKLPCLLLAFQFFQPVNPVLILGVKLHRFFVILDGQFLFSGGSIRLAQAVIYVG